VELALSYLPEPPFWDENLPLQSLRGSVDSVAEA
jgi:hypothetical protein